MSRVKGGAKTRQRRKKWLKLAKGYKGTRGRLYRIARAQVMKSLAHAYRDRRKKKRTFRQMTILQINIKCKKLGIKYSQFIWGLNQLNIKINRKMLACLAKENPSAFSSLVEKVKSILPK